MMNNYFDDIADKIPSVPFVSDQEIAARRALAESGNNRNCLSYWYPLIKDVVPTPKTLIGTIEDGWKMAAILDGESCPEFDAAVLLVGELAGEIGYPCFLRTGQGSGKHDWSNCCYLASPEVVESHVEVLVNWSHMVDFMGLPHNVWVVREMLPIKPLFRCLAYSGMPVVREWRAFVDDGRVVYGIPYWPEDALAQGKPDDPAWKAMLPELHADPPAEVLDMAASVGAAVRGQWSVDLLETNSGWYVTDMAEAVRSYGYDGSRYGEERNEL